MARWSVKLSQADTRFRADCCGRHWCDCGRRRGQPKENRARWGSKRKGPETGIANRAAATAQQRCADPARGPLVVSASSVVAGPSCGAGANTQNCAVTTMPPTAVARDIRQPGKFNLEGRTRELGDQILAFMDVAEGPSIFSKKGLYGAMMEWAMRDEHFKTQLFRFVDVLPTLTSAGEVARHLKEYLGDDQVKLSPALRMGLKAAGGAGWLFGTGVKAQVTGMARQFMLGNEEKE